MNQRSALTTGNGIRGIRWRFLGTAPLRETHQPQNYPERCGRTLTIPARLPIACSVFVHFFPCIGVTGVGCRGPIPGDGCRFARSRLEPQIGQNWNLHLLAVLLAIN